MNYMISFSGIDCGGKSTQMELVYRELGNEKMKVKMIHSRVGYTPLLEFAKSIVRKDKNKSKEEQNAYREAIHKNGKKQKLLLWLSIFDMGMFYGIHFRTVEFFGTTILADRYFWDSFIDLKMKYSEYDFESWKVWKFAKKIYLHPKKSIIYTIPAELSMYRSTLKDEPWPEEKEVREERISKYMEEIENNRWDYVIDATSSIEEVFEKTMRAIRE